MAKAKVKGVDEVMRNLERHIENIEGGALAGVVAAATFVKKRSQERVPVRQGNLRSSAYVMTKFGEQGISGGFTGKDAGKIESAHKSSQVKILGRVGRDVAFNRITAGLAYGAPYSVIVHELPSAGAAGFDPEQVVTGRRAVLVHSAVGETKFLERPVNENRKNVFDIIKRHSKVKGTL